MGEKDIKASVETQLQLRLKIMEDAVQSMRKMHAEFTASEVNSIKELDDELSARVFRRIQLLQTQRPDLWRAICQCPTEER